MLRAIELKREDVYICNILKCRPPNNRDPGPAERAACMPLLLEQIETIQPRIILMLGRVAAQTLLNSNLTLEKLRGVVHTFQGIPSYVTYHPAALLRNTHWKRPAWADLQKFRDHYRSLD
ncbi:MAG: Uracil DNA glycosylase superfamily protein [Candidatus Cloacimonetes bacterium ADurb.Bin117]|nr:MAG: Uracil DNA glycosylase superfamily protein [Candidatus Cloacimonetes bacterium ADurb.Bin117]